MTEKGVPTGKWPALPPQLQAEHFDLATSEATLTVRRPDGTEVDIPIEREELIIGRHKDEVDLALEDDLVSRRHAKLVVDKRGYFTLDDLGSKNGVEFEGRVVRRINLLDGDVFKIGSSIFVFKANIPRYRHIAKNEPPVMGSIMAHISIPPAVREDLDESAPVGWRPELPRENKEGPQKALPSEDASED